ncbi:MAG: L,D-transpeptidase family protein [Alphaproteobacteria bacterium]
MRAAMIALGITGSLCVTVTVSNAQAPADTPAAVMTVGTPQQASVAVDDNAVEAATSEVTKADRVLVVKSERRLYLLKDGEPFKSYRVALGRRPVGPKTRQGDGRTPEGIYVLDWRNPHSQFHRSIHISYPDPGDVALARRRGLPPGENIMIHGLSSEFAILGPHHARFNWTQGCIAVTNEEIEEIWTAVDDGTLIEIRP